jgi:hypothetical protein
MVLVTSSLVLVYLCLHCVLGMVVYGLRGSCLQSIGVASLIYTVRLVTPVRTVTTCIGLLSSCGTEVELFLARLNFIVYNDSPDYFADVILLCHPFK